jgi:cellulose synthase/poly-beta-1,6-N-acetylglucosamine synthase-like glycosyltransferase
VLVCLTPITVLLATRLARLPVDPVLGAYAVLTLCTLATVMYIAFACYDDPSESPSVAAWRPLVSCLVAARDEEGNIERCVRSLLGSTYTRIEVIAVDDGSTDATGERLAALAAESESLQVIALRQSVGKKRALTRAAAVAKGALLVFTDSDCVVEPDAIERIVTTFAAKPDLGAASGHARALNADRNVLTKAQDTWYEGQFSVWKAAESVFGAVTCISGPLAAFRREAIWNYFPAWAEDRFLGREFPFATDRQLTALVLAQERVGPRLQQLHADSPFLEVRYPVRRWRVEYVASARVRTIVPDSVRRLFRQQVRWKKSFIRNLFFTGRHYWRRGPGPSLLFYSHVLFVLAMPVMALRHLVWFPLHGAWTLSGLYVCGIGVKGSAWALAYRARNPGCRRWVYRPLMSLMATAFFSLLLLYSAITLRRSVWARG